MDNIKISYDGQCPECTSTDWKLACDLHAGSPEQDLYAPPPEPAEYGSKNNRLINCQRRVDEAPKVKNCRWLLKDRFEKDRSILLAFQSYEKNSALWHAARVCRQCGTWFVTETDFQSAAISFEIPEWPPCL